MHVLVLSTNQVLFAIIKSIMFGVKDKRIGEEGGSARPFQWKEVDNNESKVRGKDGESHLTTILEARTTL